MLAVIGIVYPFVMTWIILWVTDRTVGLQVTPGDEDAGLDLSEHAEVSYQQSEAAPDGISASVVPVPRPPQPTETT